MASSKITEDYELLPVYAANEGVETEAETVYEPAVEPVAVKAEVRRVWTPFFSSVCFHVFMVIYGAVLLSNFAFPRVNVNLVTAEVDKTLLVQMHKTIDSLETVMEGSTRNISSLLPETWPHGYYRAHFRGLCRKNDNSPSVCYYGLNMEELFVGDIGLQIAQFNGMEDPMLFRKEFIKSYRDMKQDLRWNLTKRRSYYSGDTVTYDGINARTYNNLPPTGQFARSQVFYYIHILFLLTMFIAAMRGWWNGESGFLFCAILLLIASTVSALPLFRGLWDCWRELEDFFVTVYAGPQLLLEYAAAFAFVTSFFHLPILGAAAAEESYRQMLEAREEQQKRESEEVSGV